MHRTSAASALLLYFVDLTRAAPTAARQPRVRVWLTRPCFSAVALAPSQIAIFTVMVQLPTLLTGKMSYVDIGWPVGVVAVALTALTGQGWAARKMLVSRITQLASNVSSTSTQLDDRVHGAGVGPPI